MVDALETVDEEVDSEDGVVQESLPAVLSNLLLTYPNIVELTKRMERPSAINDYNKNHPATWSRIKESAHPAGELRKLVAQMYLELRPINDPSMKRLGGASFGSQLGEVCKKLDRYCRHFDEDFMSLQNRWALWEFLDKRGFKL
jgi:hypothetical protein